jgi:hypothetical protein
MKLLSLVNSIILSWFENNTSKPLDRLNRLMYIDLSLIYITTAINMDVIKLTIEIIIVNVFIRQ